MSPILIQEKVYLSRQYSKKHYLASLDRLVVFFFFRTTTHSCIHKIQPINHLYSRILPRSAEHCRCYCSPGSSLGQACLGSKMTANNFKPLNPFCNMGPLFSFYFTLYICLFLSSSLKMNKENPALL